MITIKTVEGNGNGYGSATLHIAKGTPYTTMILGAEMLVEDLLKENPNFTIDNVLEDIKRIYIRDNEIKGDEENE